MKNGYGRINPFIFSSSEMITGLMELHWYANRQNNKRHPYDPGHCASLGIDCAGIFLVSPQSD
jgi:hypothetical protein